jgi:small GTP-binding protein
MIRNKFDYSAKIVVVGDSGVGKTCLLLRFVRNQWVPDALSTFGVEFLAKIISTDRHRIQLQLWDTAGQELFKCVTKGYYRGAMGALVVFDLTSRESFDHVAEWLNDLYEVVRTKIPIVLVGNKCDLSDDRDVTTKEARKFADAHGLAYVETSAKSGDNISEAVTGCARQIEKEIDEGKVILPEAQRLATQASSEGDGCKC